jgi:hypothetical protein
VIWLTWRQLRTQTAVVLAAVVAFMVTLAVTGPGLRRLVRSGGNVFDLLSPLDLDLFNAGIVVLAVTPAVLGSFWGSPLVARELESGTYRLVWSQGVTRTRWLAVRLSTTVLATAVAVGGLSLAVTWWSGPIDGVLSSTRGSLPSRLTPVAYAMRGVVPVGYAVFALTLGVALGLLLRRSVPAMALTLALTAFVQIVMPLWVRPHLAVPVTQYVAFSRERLDSIAADGSGRPVKISLNTGSADNWVLDNETVDEQHRPTALPSWLASCLPGPPAPGTAVQRTKAPDISTCLDRLTAEGYRQRVVFQPASRFWQLQWTETGLLLAVSALLAGFSFWRTRRLEKSRPATHGPIDWMRKLGRRSLCSGCRTLHGEGESGRPKPLHAHVTHRGRRGQHSAAVRQRIVVQGEAERGLAEHDRCRLVARIPLGRDHAAVARSGRGPCPDLHPEVPAAAGLLGGPLARCR